MSLFQKDQIETAGTDFGEQNINYNEPPQNQPTIPHENVIAGIVGAFLGSLLGVVAIVVISQLGYVAAISGIIMGVCTLKGYELLAKGFSKKSIFISTIIAIIMVYVAHNIDYAIFIAVYSGVTFFEAYQVLRMLITEEPELAREFYGGLAMLYLFTLLGLVPTIWQKIKEHR